MNKSILIINCAEPEIREFVNPLLEICQNKKAKSEIVEYKELGNIDIEKFNGVIISGSPCGDDIVDHHKPYFEWVRNFKKPILGICAGHHIIGAIYGAKLIREKEKEIGQISINIETYYKLFTDYNNPFKGEAMHHDSITIPEGFQVIATSEKCKNQVMKKEDRNWFTSQFHPEKGNNKIIENFIDYYI